MGGNTKVRGNNAGISLYSYLSQMNKMLCGGGEQQTMYTHVSKCKKTIK
jgi:hypothetical protein